MGRIAHHRWVFQSGSVWAILFCERVLCIRSENRSRLNRLDATQGQSPVNEPLVCPRCNKPLVDFDAPPPEETGTSCNPINSPQCWGKVTEADLQRGEELAREHGWE